jgi:hypothetical protein
VAGVEANDEARLLLDFLRHRVGRDVVDCRWVKVESVVGVICVSPVGAKTASVACTCAALH